MNLKKPLLIAGVAGTVALTSLSGAAVVSAESNSTNKADSLVSKIAKRFNLKESEVKAVFEEEHDARQADRLEKLEEKLTEAANEGKITTEQKAKILAKAKELQAAWDAKRELMKDKSEEERKAVRKQARNELEQWAKDNDIPANLLRFLDGHKGPHKSRSPQ